MYQMLVDLVIGYVGLHEDHTRTGRTGLLMIGVPHGFLNRDYPQVVDRGWPG